MFRLALCTLLATSRAFLLGPMRPTAVHAVARRPAAVTAAADATQDVITFSPTALAQLKVLREKQGADELHIRMGVRSGGCSGMSYVMDFMQESDVAESDTVLDYQEGIKCVIDPKSLMFIYGLKLDYSDALIGGGFSFQNPNAESTCGCGKSFGV